MNQERKKQFSIGVVLSYTVVGAKLLSGLLYTPVILKTLGQREYGVYSLCISFIGYLTIFNAGMNAAYIRFYVQAKEKGNVTTADINGMFFKIFLCLGTVGMACSAAIGINASTVFGNKLMPGEYGILKTSFFFIAAIVPVMSFQGMFSSVIIANERFIAGKFIDLLQTVFIPLATVPFLYQGYGSIAILAVNLVVTFITLVYQYAYVNRRLKFTVSFRSGNRVLFGSVIVFAGFILIQSVTDQLNWQIDKYILARYRGSDEVAVYSVGSTFNNYFVTITYSMAGMFIAEINKLAANGKDTQLSELFTKIARLLTHVVVFIISFYAVFGKPFICRWAGREYQDAYYVGLLIMTPMTFSLSQGLGQDIARAKNLHKKQIVINIIVCILNFAVSIPLAIKYGAIGSALGTFLCEVVICIIVQGVYYHRVVKIDMKNYYRQMVKISIGWILPFVSGITLYCVGFVRDSYQSIFLYGAAYLVVYALSVYMFSLSRKERDYVNGMLRKLGRIRKQ